MSIEFLSILFACILIILVILNMFDINMFFVIVLFAITICYLCIPPKLNSDLIIEEYLRNSYESNIKKDDISGILKSYDKNAELLDIETYKIPNSKSLYVKLDIRKGKPIYRDLKYKYTIGINDNKVFIKKGD